MVSVAISKLGCSELIFVEPAAKVDSVYYCNILLSQHLLPTTSQLADVYLFQQDSGPAHCISDANSSMLFGHADIYPPSC